MDGAGLRRRRDHGWRRRRRRWREMGRPVGPPVLGAAGTRCSPGGGAGRERAAGAAAEALETPAEVPAARARLDLPAQTPADVTVPRAAPRAAPPRPTARRPRASRGVARAPSGHRTPSSVRDGVRRAPARARRRAHPRGVDGRRLPSGRPSRPTGEVVPRLYRRVAAGEERRSLGLSTGPMPNAPEERVAMVDAIRRRSGSGSRGRGRPLGPASSAPSGTARGRTGRRSRAWPSGSRRSTPTSQPARRRAGRGVPRGRPRPRGSRAPR